MRLMKRNLRPLWYRLYRGNTKILDEDGYETGEKNVIYDDPVKLWCSISPSSGIAEQEQFGVIENYDKIIMTDKMDCPINENTILYIYEDPKRRTMLKIRLALNPFGDVAFKSEVTNKHQYIVRRVAKSLNHISYGVKEVKVS